MIERAKQMGLIIKSAPVKMALEFAPALSIEKDVIDETCEILEEVIIEEQNNLHYKNG